MLVNKLVVIPTQETMDYLTQVFSGCPFDVDLQQLCIEINTSREPMMAQPDLVYQVIAGDMDVFYDSSVGMSSLILPVTSAALAHRFVELQDTAPHAFHRLYFPHATFVEPMPALPRHYRGFINSVASTLRSGDQPLLFDAEMVIPTNVDSPPDIDYYEVQQKLSMAPLRFVQPG